MRRLFPSMLLAVFFALPAATPLPALPLHSWVVPSPSHGQTFSFGSERHRQWISRGRDHHLALATEFTNDPYVDRISPRQYDYFIFDFPDIRLGSDGKTFYYHPPGGASIAVAATHSGFLGLEEISLLDNSILLMRKPHGYLSLELVVDPFSSSKTGFEG